VCVYIYIIYIYIYIYMCVCVCVYRERGALWGAMGERGAGGGNKHIRMFVDTDRYIDVCVCIYICVGLALNPRYL